ncbi:ExbD/TolR family protein [Melioribacteraceae bacterium 4301-Me]|uniref:ExbD/TolR family protein n=1 Tax=Pyranulibacter aquaticus TaxID=3163344 RepID=UPI003598DC54
MPHIKKARVPIRIDMTPMVDVAFLLLTFFMLTTQFRPPEEVQIILPLSHADVKLPESNIMKITVSDSGKVYLGFDSFYMMQSMFGQENRLKESVPVTLDQLPDLLIKARISNPKLRTIINADANVDYGIISDIMDILQKTQITRFAMVTNLKTEKS